MKVRLEFSSQIRRLLSCEDGDLELAEGGTVQDAVRELVAGLGEPARPYLLDESGVLKPSVLIFVGGAQREWSDPAPLREGETLTFLSPIAGG